MKLNIFLTAVGIFCFWYLFFGDTRLQIGIHPESNIKFSTPRTRAVPIRDTAPSVDPDRQEEELDAGHCLAVALWGEGRGGTTEDRLWIGFTLVRGAGKKDICSALQIPWRVTSITKNTQLRSILGKRDQTPDLPTKLDRKVWTDCLLLASAILAKKQPDPTKGATHFLNPEVTLKKYGKLPTWYYEYELVGEVGDHEYFKNPAI